MWEYNYENLGTDKPVAILKNGNYTLLRVYETRYAYYTVPEHISISSFCLPFYKIKELNSVNVTDSNLVIACKAIEENYNEQIELISKSLN